MLLVNSFDDDSSLADSTETISRLDRLACLFINLHRTLFAWSAMNLFLIVYFLNNLLN